jgi:hypothetical protein
MTRSFVLCKPHKYYSGYQIKTTEMGRARSTYGETRGACRVLMGTPDGRRPLGRPRRMLEDDIKMDLLQARWDVESLIRLRIGT